MTSKTPPLDFFLKLPNIPDNSEVPAYSINDMPDSTSASTELAPTIEILQDLIATPFKLDAIIAFGNGLAKLKDLWEARQDYYKQQESEPDEFPTYTDELILLRAFLHGGSDDIYLVLALLIRYADKLNSLLFPNMNNSVTPNKQKVKNGDVNSEQRLEDMSIQQIEESIASTVQELLQLMPQLKQEIIDYANKIKVLERHFVMFDFHGNSIELRLVYSIDKVAEPCESQQNIYCLNLTDTRLPGILLQLQQNLKASNELKLYLDHYIRPPFIKAASNKNKKQAPETSETKPFSIQRRAIEPRIKSATLAEMLERLFVLELLQTSADAAAELSILQTYTSCELQHLLEDIITRFDDSYVAKKVHGPYYPTLSIQVHYDEIDDQTRVQHLQSSLLKYLLSRIISNVIHQVANSSEEQANTSSIYEIHIYPLRTGEFVIISRQSLHAGSIFEQSEKFILTQDDFTARFNDSSPFRGGTTTTILRKLKKMNVPIQFFMFPLDNHLHERLAELPNFLPSSIVTTIRSLISKIQDTESALQTGVVHILTLNRAN